MILSLGGRDELEPEHVSIGSRVRPDDLGMLERGPVRRGSDPKRAHVTDRDGCVDRHAQPSGARVEGETCATDGSEQLDLGIEGPSSRPAARATMQGNVRPTPREHRSKSRGNGHQDTWTVPKREIVDQSILLRLPRKTIARPPLGGMHPR